MRQQHEFDPKVLKDIKKSSTFPAFSTFESRIRTFETWPIEYILPKQILAEGGFFYSDKCTDEVTCYSCGLKLKNFDPLEDPYALHAVFNYKCKYNIYLMGKDFIEDSIKPKNKNAEYLKCKICLDRALNVLMLPCRHIVSCDYCSRRISNCPVCRTPIMKEESVYLN